MLGKQIRYVAFGSGTGAVHVEDRIDALTLAWKADPTIKSRAWRIVDPHEPFTDEARIVTLIVQHSRPSDKCMARLGTVGVVNYSVSVRILASQKTRPGWGTERRRGKGISEVGALARQPVGVG